ncbi:hypothetical protein BGX23_000556, partial [Mortierella sp. AD031]
MSSTNTVHHLPTDTPEGIRRSTVYDVLATTNPFSKEVTDLLVEIFFEHCFQIFTLF